MTTAEIIDYYADLLILQYKQRPKAYATIQALVAESVMDQLPISLQNAFSIDTAVGVQLDTIGKYFNVSRTGTTFTGTITLNDSDFRQLIRFAIIKNTSKSTLYDIQNLIQQFFPDDFVVFDTKSMSLSYYFSSTIGSQDLAEMIALQGLLPVPMAVGVSALIYAAVINNFFGMIGYEVAYFPAWSIGTTYSEHAVAQNAGQYWISLQNGNIGNTPTVGAFWDYYTGNYATGFETYSGGFTGNQWLTYQDAIIIP